MNVLRALLWPVLLLAGTAAATPVEESDDLQLHPLRMTPDPWKDFRLTLDGYLRVRADVWNDLDLSRGPTPTRTWISNGERTSTPGR